MDTNTAYAEALLSAYESILYDRMNETLSDLIREAMLEAVSPIIRIVRKDTTIAINRDDYGYNDIIRFILSDMSDDTAIIIDGQDILSCD